MSGLLRRLVTAAGDVVRGRPSWTIADRPSPGTALVVGYSEETDRVRAIIVGTPGIGSQIELAVRTDGPDPIKPSGIWKVFVFADDAQVLFDAAVAAGATPVAPPKLLEAFGIVLAFVEDPDGYLIEIGQRVSS